jgi:group I intron endonuclease
MKTSGIYIIKNTVTLSSYVGSAGNIAGRWASHRHSLKHHKKSPPKLQRAWDKYGAEAFVFDVLATCPKEDLLREEQRWINALKPKYNTRATAESNFGVKWPEEINGKKGRPNNILTFDGISAGLSVMAQKFGLPPSTVSSRLSRGWTVEAALKTPWMSPAEKGRKGKKPGKPKMRTAFGKTASMKALLLEFGSVNLAAAQRRLALGWTVERAISEPLQTDAQRGAAVANSPTLQTFEFRGDKGSLKQLCEKYGVVSYGVLLARRVRGWALDRALITPKVTR